MEVRAPPTRTWTVRPTAGEATAAAATRAAARTRVRRITFPPSARGTGFGARVRSSDSELPPAPPSRPEGQWRLAREHLPLQRRDRAGLAPASLVRAPMLWRHPTTPIGWVPC